jgi:signal peptidase I
MTLYKISFGLVLLTFLSCQSQDRKLPDDIKTTACFRTNSSIIPTNKLVPDVKIQKGDAIVFDYVRDKGYNREIINGDTVVTADTDFYERVTFAISSTGDTFYYPGDSLIFVNGYYEFHGGESPLANTDFKIKKGYIKGHRLNGNWIINASIGVVDKQKSDTIIQEIKFSETFKNCN